LTSNSRQYHTVPFARWRNMVSDLCDLGQRQNNIHGFLEVDVTVPRACLRQVKARTGESLSFTGYVTHCLAQAVAQDKQVQAFRQGRKLVIFEDVDVALMIEGEIEGRKIVVNHVVRAAQGKGVEQIHREIRAAQAGVKERVRQQSRFRFITSLPWFARSLVFRFMRSNAQIWSAMAGTVAITSVGMFGPGRMGWGLPIAPAPLMLTLGGISEKPMVINGRIEPREILCMTISLDHDVVDGAPAARFVARLTELLEAGHGLAAEAQSQETGAGDGTEVGA
jgi:pyruvate/2-oxoglutarate dehydrogenase complex dihydrolipoamide acyltransferase (E2) component